MCTHVCIYFLCTFVCYWGWREGFVLIPKASSLFLTPCPCGKFMYCGLYLWNILSLIIQRSVVIREVKNTEIHHSIAAGFIPFLNCGCTLTVYVFHGLGGCKMAHSYSLYSLMVTWPLTNSAVLKIVYLYMCVSVPKPIAHCLWHVTSLTASLKCVAMSQPL